MSVDNAQRYASRVSLTTRSHSFQFSWSFGRHQVQKHKLSLGVLIMVKHYASRVTATMPKHEMSLEVLIMLKNTLPG